MSLFSQYEAGPAKRGKRLRAILDHASARVRFYELFGNRLIALPKHQLR